MRHPPPPRSQSRTALAHSLNLPSAGWRTAVLAAALALSLLPTVAAAQSAPASSPPSNSPPASAPASTSPTRAPEASYSSSKPDENTSAKVKETASDWGDKIKHTSQRLIDTTKDVFAKLAEKIPGTQAYDKAKGKPDGDQHSSSVPAPSRP